MNRLGGRARTGWHIGVVLFITLLVVAMVSSTAFAGQPRLRVRRAPGAPSALNDLFGSLTATIGFDDLLEEKLFEIIISGDSGELFGLGFDIDIELPSLGVDGGFEGLKVGCLQIPAGKSTVRFANNNSIQVDLDTFDVQVIGDLGDSLRDDTTASGGALVGFTDAELADLEGLGESFLASRAFPTLNMTWTVILFNCA
ncbi:MAG: hypothetical protein ACE5JP_05705, partial [Candidatus Bipolaricaulia bacterium]